MRLPSLDWMSNTITINSFEHCCFWLCFHQIHLIEACITIIFKNFESYVMSWGVEDQHCTSSLQRQVAGSYLKEANDVSKDVGTAWRAFCCCWLSWEFPTPVSLVYPARRTAGMWLWSWELKFEFRHAAARSAANLSESSQAMFCLKAPTPLML